MDTEQQCHRAIHDAPENGTFQARKLFFKAADILRGDSDIQLEPSVTIKTTDFDAFGNDFEKTNKGYIDFLLLDSKGFPFIVLEAKSEDKNLLVGKEQARKYARSQNCRFVILSNGNLHYFWDLDRGNPYIISRSLRRIRSWVTGKWPPIRSVSSMRPLAKITSF
jgi:hypothetical protein